MITLQFKNHSFSNILFDNIEEVTDIWEHFSFYVPGYRFMPAYERGTWDGKIRLVNLSNRTFPTGLISHIEQYLKDFGLEYKKENFPEPYTSISKETVEDFINAHTYYSKGKEITPRADQKSAIIRAICNKRCINICPTSFGKSLCIFIQALWHIENYHSKIVIVVPSVNLVRQFKNDILDYCTGDNGVKVPVMQEIHAGTPKEIKPDTDIVITTWQSIYKLNKSWINQFGCLILDEAHKGSANCIRTVFENAENIEYRTGWTGSLKEASLVEIQTEALIGPAKVITTASALMNEGVVADLTVEFIRFQYSEDIINNGNIIEEFLRYTGKGTDGYKKEIQFLETFYPRNKMLINMVKCLKNTGLLLYTHVKHGQVLYELARQMCPDRNIYRIDGNCVLRNDEKYATYEELKGIIEQEKDAILICSFGVFSTGISIKNIHYIFFTVPVKSYVRTIQSIGRGLRISDNKHSVRLFDIVDDLCKKTKSRTKKNFAYKHFEDRFVIYAEQRFKYNMSTIPISWR